jgi:hypothetical protein
MEPANRWYPPVGPARRVRRLRLRAPDQTSARQAQGRLEDALHSASLEGTATARLVLVRRLALGAVDPTAPPPVLIDLIERRYRALLDHAVHGSDARAATSDVVWFADWTEGLAWLLAQLRQTGTVPNFPGGSLVPGITRAGSRPAQLRLLLARAMATPAGPAAVVALLDRAAAAGDLDGVLDALDEQDAVDLLEVCGWNGAAPAPAAGIASRAIGLARPAPSTVDAFALRWRPLLARWSGRGPTHDRRALLVATLALVAGRLDRLGAASVLEEAERIVRQSRAAAGADVATAAAIVADQDATAVTPERQMSMEARAVPCAREIAPGSRSVSRAGDAAPEPASRQADARLETTSRSLSPPAQDATGAQLRRDHGPPPERPRGGGGGWPRPSAATSIQTTWDSAVGGLLFLIPLLERLGIRCFVAGHEAAVDTGFGARVLLLAAARAGAGAGDPLSAALASSLDDAPSSHLARFVVPPSVAPLRARAGAFVGGSSLAHADSQVLPVDDDLCVALAAFWLALRRRAWVDTGLSLRTLVRRPAALTCTPTHIDLSFEPRQADLRIRRSALDANPGWVPWLGKVVMFHYDGSRGARG